MKYEFTLDVIHVDLFINLCYTLVINFTESQKGRKELLS